MKKLQKKCLDMRFEKASRRTVWRHYLAWRNQREMPLRCDNVDCRFFSDPLEWNKKRLKPILDHKSGNSADNRPANLRFLCPNCDSQNIETRGGANARRIEQFPDGSYMAKRKSGTTDAFLRATSTAPATSFGTPSASSGSPVTEVTLANTLAQDTQ